MGSGAVRGIAVTIVLLALLAGCSSRKTVTSAEDQSLLQGPRATTHPATTEPLLTEAARATQPSVDSSPPPAMTGTPIPAVPNNPVRSESSQTASALPSIPGMLADVYFDYDRFALRHDARAILETNARWLKAQNGVRVLIEGHCDERGTSSYNLVLGERRAQSVKRYLQELGVPSSRLQIVSYGKERPFCTEHREACWQQNRRGHFVVK